MLPSRESLLASISAVITFPALDLVVVVGFKANCPLEGPGSVGGIPSVRVFLRDPRKYLCEFRRKPPKTLKGLVNKCERELNPAHSR